MQPVIKYTKATPKYFSPCPNDNKLGNLVLRLSLGDMPLEDSLWLQMKVKRSPGDLQAVLDNAFPIDPKSRHSVVSSLDVKENPDAPEMYMEIESMLSLYRTDRAALRFFINNGPEILESDNIFKYVKKIPTVTLGQRRLGFLDLIIDQEFTPLQYLSKSDRWESTQQIIDWLNETMLLLYIGSYGTAKISDPIRYNPTLFNTTRKLKDRRLINSEDDISYSIAEKGEEIITEFGNRFESQTEYYGVFGDVVYRGRAEDPLFGTGRGEDLRGIICEKEGFDPLLTVCMIRIGDSPINESLDNWINNCGSEEYYNWFLEPAVNYPDISWPDLESIIDSGINYNEEQQESKTVMDAQMAALKRADQAQQR